MNSSLPSLACMEILKLQLLASYAFLALGRPLPFVSTSAAFLAAIFLSGGLKRVGGLRKITRILIHLAAFALCLLASFALFRSPGMSLASAFSGMAADPSAMYATLAVMGVFWLRAIWLEAVPRSHEFTIARFDEGLAEFLLVLIMAAVVEVENPIAGAIVVPYFAFSILALGISRLRTARRGGFQGRGRWAVLVSSAAGFGLAAWGILRLVPALGAPARRAAASLGAAALGILKFFEMLIVWLFRPRPGRPMAAADEANYLRASTPEAAEGGYSTFATIIMWLVLGLLAFVALLLLAILITNLVRLLARRSPKAAGKPRRPGAGKWLGAFLRRLSRIFTTFLLRRRRLRGYSPALSAYARLLACGRAGGVRRKASETPREFAARLESLFPGPAAGADLIVRALESEIYGASPPGRNALTALKAARARLMPLGFLLARLAMAIPRHRGNATRPARISA